MNNLNLPKIERIEINGKRHYTDGNFVYPSVTTVLGEFEDLSKWRARIGTEKADKITRQAGVRGTKFHNQVEHYLLEKTIPKFKSPLEQQLFINTKTILDRISNISLLEAFLYSHHLRLAGTVDCIAEFDGKLSAIDFKSSLRQKELHHIDNYFEQATAYAIMHEELTKIPIPNLVIIIGVEGAPSQVFKSKRNRHVKELLSKRDRYEEKYL